MGCGKLVPIITKAGEVFLGSLVNGALAPAGSVARASNKLDSAARELQSGFWMRNSAQSGIR